MARQSLSVVPPEREILRQQPAREERVEVADELAVGVEPERGAGAGRRPGEHLRGRILWKAVAAAGSAAGSGLPAAGGRIVQPGTAAAVGNGR